MDSRTASEHTNSLLKEINMNNNNYDEAVKNALQKVFESISLTGTPTAEQLKFIEMFKPKPKPRTLDDDIKTAEKLFALVFGSDIGGKK